MSRHVTETLPQGSEDYFSHSAACPHSSSLFRATRPAAHTEAGRFVGIFCLNSNRPALRAPTNSAEPTNPLPLCLPRFSFVFPQGQNTTRASFSVFNFGCCELPEQFMKVETCLFLQISLISGAFASRLEPAA